MHTFTCFFSSETNSFLSPIAYSLWLADSLIWFVYIAFLPFLQSFLVSLSFRLDLLVALIKGPAGQQTQITLKRRRNGKRQAYIETRCTFRIISVRSEEVLNENK
jgi:hypothetical protein